MKKLIIASASAIALFGLAACSDTDETTTQSVPDAAVEVEPAEEGAVIIDEEEEPVETESVAPEAEEAPAN